MLNLNEVTLIGRVGSDPVVSGENKKPFASVSLATNKMLKEGEEVKTYTTWHKLVFFGNLAESVKQHVKKGAGLFIKGELENQAWQDKNNVVHNTSQIVVRKFCSIEDKKNDEQAANA